MTALRDRSTAARTVDRALAKLAGVLDHRPGGDVRADPIPSPKRSGEAAVDPAGEPGPENSAGPDDTTTTSDVDLVTRKVRAERQRIAAALHDDVSPVLFAMAARARRSSELDGDDPAALRATVSLLADQLQDAHTRLRAVIHDCGPTSASDTIPVATQRDLDDFTERTGIATHLLVQGRPAHLPPAAERVALNCLRQGLFNIERHAGAAVVVVTLDYRADRLRLVVQDDGRGLPDGFEPRAVPRDGHNWGFTSMAEQVQRLGGSVQLRQAPDTEGDGGGTQLRVELPRPPDPRRAETHRAETHRAEAP